MRARRVLVTGGAGFVGSHLVDALVERGDTVRILDSLDPQVHGSARQPPAWLNAGAELQLGDVRDGDAVAKAVRDVDVVYHLAASVGVGQSMYEIASYTAVNNLGTANLLQAIVDGRHELDRLVVASSMSIYGEGRYERTDGRAPIAHRRSAQQLRDHDWELRDPDGTPLTPVPTDESKPADPTSIYALSKADQETMCLMVGAAYGVPSTALRFFNIYGPRQALSNPYTGVVAIFSGRLLDGQPPLIFEDGMQRRDFVSVHDIVQALLQSAEEPAAVGQVINVGSGRAITVRDVAISLARVMGRDIDPVVTGRYRVGDIRNCTADISRAREILGYEPAVTLDEGLRELLSWLTREATPGNDIEQHADELVARGLSY